jgi:YegS/Rv2252/BmrU family lipid kinase
VIVNPMSGGGATGRRWPELRRALDPVLDDWDNAFTLGPADATRLVREAVAEGYDEIVVVGGDGTLNEAVNGWFGEDDHGERSGAEQLPVLIPVRFGTGGDFARHLGLSSRLPEAVAHVRDGKIGSIDLGQVRFVDPEGVAQQRWFLNIASFGLSGLVDAKVNASKKRLKGASFTLATVSSLLTYRPPAVRIDVDGERVYEGPVVTAAVANGTTFGGGMQFARGAAIDDGRFSVVIQKRAGLTEALRMPDLYSGALHRWSSVQVVDGCEVVAEPVDPEAEVLLDVDGEQPGRLPARFTIVPGALRLKRP